MKHLPRSFVLLTLLASCSAHALAQDFRVEGSSPQKAAGTETFTSLDSRFSIALPQQVSGFGPITGETPQGKVTIGSSYKWRLAGMHFEVGHTDFSKLPNANAEPKAVLNMGAAGLIEQMEKKGAKALGNKEISLAGVSGREVKIEFPDTTIFVNRMYVTNNQLYQVVAGYRKDPKLEEFAVGILDSFKLLTAAEAEAAIRKKVEESTPSPLPQEPAAKKLRSDAEDEGLKGRVKTVFTEVEDLSGTWAVQRRKPSAREYYNEQGNLTKRESYDYKGNPMDITVYGYIGGERVSKIGDIEYEYNPPAMVIAGPSGPVGPESKRDPRYTYKFKYRYDDKGRLAEEAWFHSDGRPWLRYVYNYKGNQRDELVYSADGALNQKYAVTLDDKGNEVEETIFEVKDASVRSGYRYAYEFDAQGNWTKKTSSKLVTKDGGPRYEPYSVTHRIIIYY